MLICNLMLWTSSPGTVPQRWPSLSSSKGDSSDTMFCVVVNKDAAPQSSFTCEWPSVGFTSSSVLYVQWVKRLGYRSSCSLRVHSSKPLKYPSALPGSIDWINESLPFLPSVRLTSTDTILAQSTPCPCYSMAACRFFMKSAGCP